MRHRRLPNLGPALACAASISWLACAPSGEATNVRALAPDWTEETAQRAVSWGALAQALPSTPTWTTLAPMGQARAQFGAAMLPSGDLLVAGGVNRQGFVASAERFEPLTGRWRPVSPPGITGNVTGGLTLPNGKVLLLADGSDTGRVFDPRTETWSATGSMSAPRSLSTMTLLSSGQVLVAGGGNLASAELFDPLTGNFTQTGAMSIPRRAHASVRLRDGRVLAVSGFGSIGEVPVAELYNPATGTWEVAAPPLVPRHYASATLLPDGRVLLAGGFTSNGVTTQAELYDPAANTWTATGALTFPRNGHTATLLPSGHVLVIGGSDDARVPQTRAELYDSATGTWTVGEALETGRENHVAALLPSGKVLVAGGFDSTPSLTFHPTVELFDPAVHVGEHTAGHQVPPGARTSLLASGELLLVGGLDGSGAPLATTARYRPDADTWTTLGSLHAARAQASVTVLASGDVLVAGGVGTGELALSSVERFSSPEGTWTAVSRMSEPRSLHTATRLPDGSVLVAGGRTSAGNASATAERYAPAEDAWVDAPALDTGRHSHGAVLLDDGSVLIVGGVSANGDALADVARLAPGAGAWAPSEPMQQARSHFSLTRLAGGRVLAVGGRSGTSVLASATVFDPQTESWTAVDPLSEGREGHAATLMPSGKVLIAGGRTSGGVASTRLEVFDPATNRFSTIDGALGGGELEALALPGGEVLLVGTGVAGGVARYSDTVVSAAWRPVVTPPQRILAGCEVTVTGTNFRGLSEASAGTYQNVPTDFPLLRLKDVESGALWSPGFVSASATHATVRIPASVRPGPHALTVFANAIPGGRMVTVEENRAPLAADAALSVSHDVPLALTLHGEDPDPEQALSFRIVIPPAHGTLTGTPPDLVYTPTPGFEGQDSLVYDVADCGLVSALATISFEVLPPDVTAPSLTCPADMVVVAANLSGANVTWSTPAVTDDQDPAPMILSVPSSGSVFPLGETEVVTTATDAAGNVSTCTFKVSVAGPAQPPPPEADGCSCQSSGSGGTGTAALTLLGGLALWSQRRRRTQG